MISRPSALRDFTVDRRVWLLTGVALVIGTGAAALAVILLRAIALATNIFYYHRLSLAMVGPAGSPLSPWLLVLAPVVGGLLVGLMAFYGSDKIRGHGIPEAIEAILLNGARVDPKVGRAFRRRRPHHHDGRSLWFTGSAMAQVDPCRTNNAAGGRSCGRHVGNFCGSVGSDLACGRVTAFRVAATFPGSGGCG